MELDEGDIHLIDEELAHLAARRRLGGLLMYAPILGLLLLIGAGVSGSPATALGSAMMALGAAMVVVGLPLAPLGLVLRVVFGVRLDRLALSLGVDHLAAAPPVSEGERLGHWRVIAADGRSIRLRHEIGPGLVAYAVRFGVDAILVSIVTLGVVAAIRSGQAGSWVGTGMLALLTIVLSAAVGGGRIDIESAHPAEAAGADGAMPGAPSIHFSGHRIWGLFTVGRWQIPPERFEGVTVSEGAMHLVTAGQGLRSVGGFGRGPYGRWQLRRLARQIAGERVRDATAASHPSRCLLAQQSLREPPAR